MTEIYKLLKTITITQEMIDAGDEAIMENAEAFCVNPDGWSRHVFEAMIEIYLSNQDRIVSDDNIRP